MVKLKRLQRGIAPFGSGWGSPVFTIEIESDDATPSPEEGKTDYQVVAEKLLLAVVDEVKKNGWDLSWTLELSGKTRGFGCYFVGDEWVSKENRVVTGEFFRIVAKLSVETQRVFGIQKMSEPFLAWVGTPKHYTTIDDFYQQFNHCVVWCPLSADYNNLAFMEQKNHAFTRFCFDVDSAEDVAKVQEFYGKAGLLEGLLPTKVQLSASPNGWEPAVEFALSHGYRVSPKQPKTPGFVEVEHF